MLYSANYTALELLLDQDLHDITLPTGVSIRVIEPCLSYALGYSDGTRLQAALRFEGVMSPEPLTSTGSTFRRSHHFDQIGRVSGEIVLHGETIPVDCLAVCDRTWGRRREDRSRQAAYVTGVATAAHGFLAVTNVEDGRNPIVYGFLRRDGPGHWCGASAGLNETGTTAGSHASRFRPVMQRDANCSPWGHH